MPLLDVSDETARRVAEQLRAGRAGSADAVVQAGVAALERAAEEAAKLEALRAAIREGEESGIAPPGTFDRMRAAIRANATRP